ncbi:hypothetical protein [Methylobacterium sp. J-068]|uniref:hypothetical protein n=1 Tax=Methylobacterium sp. J-068 TaxID=2836649 RepID=UPI001FB8631D|nr:hypothetical protein [Methylobacterium sp. J-068]MCJ2035598.1 hypothetical protein [Methylobacterium sp. J-068]
MTNIKHLSSTAEFAHDMLMKAYLNSEDMKGLSPKRQAVRMAKVFEANDLVFGAFPDLPDLAKPCGADFAEIKGGAEVLLRMQAEGETSFHMTAFMCNDRAEAELFAQIYAWRQREIDTQGRASDEIKRFWERMTPQGRIESAQEGGLGATAEQWAALMDDLKGAARLLDQVRRNMRFAAE